MWPFDPSQKSEDFVKTLKQRWGELEAWGIRTKAPETKAFQATWDAFHAEWDHGTKDVDKLQEQEQNLNSAERFAESHGFKRSGGDVVAPDIADQSAARGGAVAADEAAKEAEKAAKEAAKSLGKTGAEVASTGLGALWNGLPPGGKVAVVGLGVGAGALLLKELNETISLIKGGKRR